MKGIFLIAFHTKITLEFRKEANDLIGSSHAEEICDWLDSDKQHYSTKNRFKLVLKLCLNCSAGGSLFNALQF